MQNTQNMQNMQNMQIISPLFFLSKVQKSKISESEPSINSRTCLGHLVLLTMFNKLYTSIRNKEWEKKCITVIFSWCGHMIMFRLRIKRSISPHEGILRNGQKRGRVNQKRLKFCFAIFVKRPIKPLGKLVRTQKTDCKNLFSSRSCTIFKFGPNPPKQRDLA